jgi:hypothetical protein
LSDIDDFTTEHYATLLEIAKSRYRFGSYGEPPDSRRTILWRHDCDVSLNRAARLAAIESGKAVKSTYFVNPHSDFYNLLEKSQAQLVRNIIKLGHDIGLHFDSAYYDVESEDQLEELVAVEAKWLRDWFGVRIRAFSFHNPNTLTLTCEREEYAGLINCYSRTFKTDVAYCSDSNGYWRFKRLRDVLEQSEDQRLQILTHPEWWQEEPLPARERVVRSVYGRANACLTTYDDLLERHGRRNEGRAPADHDS